MLSQGFKWYISRNIDSPRKLNGAASTHTYIHKYTRSYTHPNREDYTSIRFHIYVYTRIYMHGHIVWTVRTIIEEQVWTRGVRSRGPDSGSRIIEHGAIERETLMHNLRYYSNLHVSSIVNGQQWPPSSKRKPKERAIRGGSLNANIQTESTKYVIQFIYVWRLGSRIYSYIFSRICKDNNTYYKNDLLTIIILLCKYTWKYIPTYFFNSFLLFTKKDKDTKKDGWRERERKKSRNVSTLLICIIARDI